MVLAAPGQRNANMDAAFTGTNPANRHQDDDELLPDCGRGSRMCNSLPPASASPVDTKYHKILDGLPHTPRIEPIESLHEVGGGS